MFFRTFKKTCIVIALQSGCYLSFSFSQVNLVAVAWKLRYDMSMIQLALAKLTLGRP